MKKSIAVLVTILAPVILVSGVITKNKIEISVQETKVKKAEDAAWAATIIALMIKQDIFDACRTDIYMPTGVIPPEAQLECKKAENELKSFSVKAEAIANNLQEERYKLMKLRGSIN